MLASRGKRFYLCLSDNKTIVWALEVEVRVEVGVRRRGLKIYISEFTRRYPFEAGSCKITFT